MKPAIVLSGVNLVDMGPLSIFREALSSLSREHGDKYEIIAIVHRRELVPVAGVTFLEYPSIKSSWIRRVWFEYRTLESISRKIQPSLWVSMHDITPNVHAKVRAVYCHNPSPFCDFDWRHAALDPRFGLFTLFYRYLYQINIRKNDFVIVQQDWMRWEFRRMFGVRDVIVAQPTVEPPKPVRLRSVAKSEHGDLIRFLYPAFPRTFKNLEVILAASRELERQGVNNFEVWLTAEGSVNRYAAHLKREFSDVRCVRWLGLQSRQRVFELYQSADCLLFPSKLETWGLPITEFKATGKPVILANLPYAHETVGDYDKCAFFNPNDFMSLAEIMRKTCRHEPFFSPSQRPRIEPPFTQNWRELWSFLVNFAEDQSRRGESYKQ